LIFCGVVGAGLAEKPSLIAVKAAPTKGYKDGKMKFDKANK